MEIREILAARALPEVSEARREAAIAAAEEAVLNYCHIEEILPELRFIVADMAGEMLAGPEAEMITEGDTSVRYAKREGLLGDYAARLQPFRKLRRG